MANSIATGVAYSDPALSGGTVDNTVIGGTTPAAVTVTDLTVNGNSVIGNEATDTIGHYGVTAVSQRALAAQHTSLLSSSTDFTAAHLNALKEIMATLTALGLWKGSA